ncbi:RTA1 like protein-domain-containing protein [Mycena galopus ATCC 62051]|nr:RTA1 like protein-domain-containing protein [Mycena galopus ATCC 62051]
MFFHQDPNSNENYSFLYCPSLPAAILFSALFGLTTIGHLIQAIHYQKRFCWVVIMAGIWETGGFILRVYNVLNTTSLAYGIPSQLLILLSPLWINAFLYVLMSRLVYFFVPEKHVGGISARRLSMCFVLLDITAFLMQAVGGTMIGNTEPKIALLGIHIYMGGIGLQQFFVLGFTALVVRFHYKMKQLDGSTAWKLPLYIMYTSIGLITIRIVFRLIEFSSGVYSPITESEAPLYCLEALPMFAALLLWNIFHPGQVLVGPDSDFPKKEKKSKKGAKTEKDLEARDLLRTPSPSL